MEPWEKEYLEIISKDKKKSKVDRSYSLIKTAISTFLIVLLVFIAVALVLPFVFFGPKHEFWETLASGDIQYKREIVGYYLNILEWISGIHS